MTARVCASLFAAWMLAACGSGDGASDAGDPGKDFAEVAEDAGGEVADPGPADPGGPDRGTEDPGAVDPGPAGDVPTDLPSDPGPAVPDGGPDACVLPDLPACPAGECGAVTELPDEAALRAFLSDLPWDEGQKAWCAISGEVRFAGPVEIAAADLPAPDWTCGKPPCRPYFQYLAPVPGVQCPGREPPAMMCSRVRFENAQFRVRPGRLQFQGWASKRVPVLDLVGPCSETCAEGEVACPNRTCSPVENGQAVMHCMMCLGGGPAECICRGGDGPLPDGTECEGVSGDVIWHGHCRCGECRQD